MLWNPLAAPEPCDLMNYEMRSKVRGGFEFVVIMMVITIALDYIFAQRAITSNGLSCSLTEALVPKYSMFEIF
jgi:hypothetical protein